MFLKVIRASDGEEIVINTDRIEMFKPCHVDGDHLKTSIWFSGDDSRHGLVIQLEFDILVRAVGATS